MATEKTRPDLDISLAELEDMVKERQDMAEGTADLLDELPVVVAKDAIMAWATRHGIIIDFGEV